MQSNFQNEKVFFCDLGLHNMIERNFNTIDFRADNGAIAENFVMLELYRNKAAGGELQFYRTTDGTEVDFVLTKTSYKTAMEGKFKRMNKPVNLQGFNNFCNEENIDNRFKIEMHTISVFNGFRSKASFSNNFFQLFCKFGNTFFRVVYNQDMDLFSRFHPVKLIPFIKQPGCCFPLFKMIFYLAAGIHKPFNFEDNEESIGFYNSSCIFGMQPAGKRI